MKDTPIEWCDSTVNPTGFQCDGCELWTTADKICYAGRFSERTGGIGAFDQPIQMKPGRMAAAAKWPDLRGVPRPTKPWIPAEYPRLIFVGDMADTLSKGVTFEYLKAEIIDVVNSDAGRRHIWMWLTKRPKRMAEFEDWLLERGIAWPRNLWPGTSVTSQKTLSRAKDLAGIGDGHIVRFLSCEPLWSSLPSLCSRLDGIKLVIAGGESGARAHACYVEWLGQIIEDCDAAGVAFFCKQLGSNVMTLNANMMDWPDDLDFAEDPPNGSFAQGRALLKHKKGGDWSQWPDQLKVRNFPALM